MKIEEMESVIEAMLFVSGTDVSLTDIANALNMDKSTTRAVIRALSDKYVTQKRGLRIIELDNSFQMCSAPECFEYVSSLCKIPRQQFMTQALLETLSIIAYKQPVTKAQIEEIRGVNADHAVNRLVERGLVCEVGRLDAPGKPLLFGTTKEFLRYFGLRSPKDLPVLEELSSAKADETEVKNKEE